MKIRLARFRPAASTIQNLFEGVDAIQIWAFSGVPAPAPSLLAFLSPRPPPHHVPRPLSSSHRRK
jgi:hypothetical protein